MTVRTPGSLSMVELGPGGRAGLRVAAIALIVLATARCHEKNPKSLDPAPPVDKPPSLAAMEGGVTIERGGQTSAAAQGGNLIEGDIVSTGADGKANLGLRGGHVVQLGPSSSASIQREAGADSPLVVMLDKGSMRAVTAPHGMHLVIGTPFGRVDIAAGSDVEMNSRGVVVRLGAIQVMQADGRKLIIPAGEHYSVDESAGPTVVLKPLKFTLTASSKEVQVKRATDMDWRTSKSQETLGADDAVRTRKAEGTRLQLDARTAVLLRPDTDLIAKESGLTAEGSTANLVLGSGNATFLAIRDATGAGGHEVEVAGQHLRIEPGPDAANVEVSTDRAGQSQIIVNLGHARLLGGETIDPGNALTLKAGASEGPPTPLAAAFIEIKAGGKTAIYCGGRVPPVRFVWEPDEAKPPFTIEVARDDRYAKKLLREEVSRPNLVYALLKPGYWFWRVRLGNTWKTGSVLVARDQGVDCAQCKRLNVIEDTGDNTTVYFQELLPAITLHWKTVATAAKYRLKLYAERSIDRPLIDEIVTTQALPLAAGSLREGKYAWNVQALDAKDKVLFTGEINGLTITYDNAISGLRIRTPQSGAVVKGTVAWTRGEVGLGEKLLINGEQATLDAKGRFSEKVTLSKGLSSIVYHALGDGPVDRYWVRDVVSD